MQRTIFIRATDLEVAGHRSTRKLADENLPTVHNGLYMGSCWGHHDVEALEVGHLNKMTWVTWLDRKGYVPLDEGA